jgi:hypothetical protein
MINLTLSSLQSLLKVEIGDNVLIPDDSGVVTKVISNPAKQPRATRCTIANTGGEVPVYQVAFSHVRGSDEGDEVPDCQ